ATKAITRCGTYSPARVKRSGRRPRRKADASSSARKRDVRATVFYGSGWRSSAPAARTVVGIFGVDPRSHVFEDAGFDGAAQLFVRRRDEGASVAADLGALAGACRDAEAVAFAHDGERAGGAEHLFGDGEAGCAGLGDVALDLAGDAFGRDAFDEGAQRSFDA